MKWNHYKSDRKQNTDPEVASPHASQPFTRLDKTQTKSGSGKPMKQSPPSQRADLYDDEEEDLEDHSGSAEGGGDLKIPFDPFRLPGGLIKRWTWPLISAGSFLLLAFLAGCFKFGDTYIATGTLIKNSIPNTFRTSEVGEPFKPNELSTASFLAVMKSTPVLQQVSAASDPYISPKMLSMFLEMEEERNTDFVWVTFKGFDSPEATADLLQLYMDELVGFLQKRQSQEANEVNTYLKNQIAQTELELASANQDLLAYTRTADFVDADKQLNTYLMELSSVELQLETAEIDYETQDISINVLIEALQRQSPVSNQIQAAQSQIDQMLLTLTENHPRVIEQRAYLQELLDKEKEKQKEQESPQNTSESGVKTNDIPSIAQLTQNPIGSDLYMQLVSMQARQAQLKAKIDRLEELRVKTQQKLASLPEKGMQYARIFAKRQTLMEARRLLSSRQREAQLFEDNAIGEYRIFTEPKVERIEVKSKWYKIGVVSLGGMGFGLFAGFFVALISEILDNRILTHRDVKRVSELEVLGSLPPLRELEPDARRQWAFRSWTKIHGQLSGEGMDGLTLGLISMKPGEGRSTWIRMLAEGAHQRGLHVIIIEAFWRPREPSKTNHHGQPHHSENDSKNDSGPCLSFPMHTLPLEEAMFDPIGNAAALFQAEPGGLFIRPEKPMIWNTPTKRAWMEAINIWSSLASFSVLVELPTADSPETLTLAESLPRLLWVCRSGMNRSNELKPVMEIYRNAHCQIHGSLVNDEEEPAWMRWLPFIG